MTSHCIMCEKEIGALGYCTKCDDKFSAKTRRDLDKLRAALEEIRELAQREIDAHASNFNDEEVANSLYGTAEEIAEKASEALK